MSSKNTFVVQGSGLGLRRELINPLQSLPENPCNFYEVAPENWINIGGRLGKQFRAFTEKHTLTTHGLSLSIGSPSPLDTEFIYEIKHFLKEHDIKLYTEHLSYCSDHGHLYDLMPIPFTEESVHHVAKRIQQVQDILEQKIAIENISYYAALGQELSEIEFLKAVLEEADCQLLLDVNNIYVNAVNHRYNPNEFLSQIPGDRIAYIHIAGHFNEAEDLLVDTHGADVIDPVWKLLEQTYQQYGVCPTLLERDFNIPPLNELLNEVNLIQTLQDQYLSSSKQSATK